MKDYKRSVKISLVVTYLLMLAMVVFMIALPFIATWYVEKKGRPADLAIVSMLSCYPCVPFATVALFSLRSLFKNFLNEKIIDSKNIVLLKRIIICCLFSSLIMIIAGFFYKPFFISGGSAMFCALVFKILMDVLSFCLLNEKKD